MGLNDEFSCVVPSGVVNWQRIGSEKLEFDLSLICLRQFIEFVNPNERLCGMSKFDVAWLYCEIIVGLAGCEDGRLQVYLGSSLLVIIH